MVDFLLGVPGKLKTLLDRLTATRAGYLDASISSRATAANLATVDTVVDAVLAHTADMQPKINTMSQYGTTIKSIQTVYINQLAVADSTGMDAYARNIGCTSVTYTKCIVIVTCADVNYKPIHARLTSATTLKFHHPNSGLVNWAGSATIIEFY